MDTDRQDQERKTDPRAVEALEARVTELFRSIFRPARRLTVSETDRTGGDDGSDDLPPAA